MSFRLSNFTANLDKVKDNITERFERYEIIERFERSEKGVDWLVEVESKEKMGECWWEVVG